MDYTQVVQSIAKNSEQLSTFKEVHVSEPISNLNNDTLYIECSFPNGVISVHNATYKLKTVVLSSEGTKNIPSDIKGIHIFSNNGIYLCSYIPEFNSLIIKQCPFDEYIPFIGDVVKTYLVTQQQTLLNELTQSHTVHIAVGDTVWTYKPTSIINTTMWHISELLKFSYSQDPVLLYDENTYVLKNKESKSLLDIRLNEVSKKATTLIEKIKKQYAEKIQQIQALHFKELNEQLAMPNVSMADVINNKLMISKYKEGIIYTFVVNIQVGIVLSNKTGKYIQLEEPIEFKNHLLAFYVGPKNRISNVKLLTQHLEPSDHLHCSHSRDNYGNLCTGTMNIYEINITGIKHLIELKNRVVTVMSAYNISHCNNRNNYEALSSKLSSEGIRMKGEHGYIYSLGETK